MDENQGALTAKTSVAPTTNDSITQTSAVETEEQHDRMQSPTGTLKPPIDERRDEFSRFLHDRFFNSIQYVTFLTQRADQAVQTYLTVLTASLGALIVLVTSSARQSSDTLQGTVAAVLLVIGVVGVVTSLRFVAYRRMRDIEKNRLYDIQQYFKEIDSIAFDKHNVGIGQAPKEVRYWHTPIVWGFGVFHAFLLAASITALIWLLVTTMGLPTDRNLWWILLVGVALCFCSIFIYSRGHRSQMR